MKKAVLCFAHNNPKQINLLIEQLLWHTNGNTDIFLHIDKNHDDIKLNILKNNHVIFIQNNIKITWGNDSMIKAMLVSFYQIYKYGKNYDYFLICTGQDLLVRPGLDEFLEANKGKLYLDIMPEEPFRRKMLTHKFPAFMCKYLGTKTNPLRIIRSIYVILIRLGLIPSKKVSFDIKKIEFYKSFNWCAMPYEAFRYIVKYLRDYPDFLKLFYKTYLPEDGFLGTILMNSPYKESVVLNYDGTGATLTYWENIKDQHMIFLTSSYKNKIDNSKCFFARKFDMGIDPAIVDTYYKLIVKK